MRFRALRTYFWALLVLWTVLVGLTFLWGMIHQEHETLETAHLQAQSAFEKDLVYRLWAAMHGGVYVPATELTPPSPYLSNVEERDIVTPSGRPLTLMNPAYMTRQVHEIGVERYGFRGHITSLNPIRSANAADLWETEALKSFEQGLMEVSSIEIMDEKEYMRLMRPLNTEQSCLKCHAEQGYKLGDLRGGISVSVLMAPLRVIARGHMITLILGHSLLWLLGLGGIILGQWRLRKQMLKHDQVQEEISQSEEKFRSLFASMNEGVALHEVIYDKHGQPIDYRILDVNPVYESVTGLKREIAVGSKASELYGASEPSYLEVFTNAAVTGMPTKFETYFEPMDKYFSVSVFSSERGKFNTVFSDISEQKQLAKQQVLSEKILRCVNQETKITDLIHGVLENIKEFTDYDAMGIRLHHGDEFPYFDSEGFSDSFVGSENCLSALDEDGCQIYDSQGKPVLECLCGAVLSGQTDMTLPFFTEGGSFWANNTAKMLEPVTAENLQRHIRIRCYQEGFKSMALIPLHSEKGIMGLLQLNNKKQNSFTIDKIHFFEGIGASIGTALARIEAEREIENLAKFPSENPNPVLRIAKDGILLYANPASDSLLSEWGCKVGQVVPESWVQTVAEIFNSTLHSRVEIKHSDRLFAFMVIPVLEAGYTNLYARDITEHKEAEQEIRELNKKLEQRVIKRTDSLARANRQLVQEIEERKRLERELLDISERERMRIGQELHDGLGQQLTGIALMSKVLQHKLTRKSLDESIDAEEISSLVNQAIDQARGLARGLHPVDLTVSGLVPALQELATMTSHLFGVSCTFEYDDSVSIEDIEVAIHVYRIAQEAITNSIKHGQAKNIWLELTLAENIKVLTVKNDGTNFPEVLAKTKGMGLQIMDYRAEVINGSLNVQKNPEGGTIVTCTFAGNNDNINMGKNHGSDKGQNKQGQSE
jgi:signal transduction histidine kinase/PAS domain-containing protein